MGSVVIGQGSYISTMPAPVVLSIEDRETHDLPPKQLLLSIVRMGAMKLVPKTGCRDMQDDGLLFPPSNIRFLLKRCEAQLEDFPHTSRPGLGTSTLILVNQCTALLLGTPRYL